MPEVHFNSIKKHNSTASLFPTKFINTSYIPVKQILQLLLLLLLSNCSTYHPPSHANYIPGKKVWQVVKKEANYQHLDPLFVYAIVIAESSLNAYADTGKSRGMMQISEDAWKMITDSSWKNAFDWTENIRVGTAYLALNKHWLKRYGKFTYPRLACVYRYGFTYLKKRHFEMNRIPMPYNRIYRALFSGNIHPVNKP